MWAMSMENASDYIKAFLTLTKYQGVLKLVTER